MGWRDSIGSRLGSPGVHREPPGSKPGRSAKPIKPLGASAEDNPLSIVHREQPCSNAMQCCAESSLNFAQHSA